MKLGVPTCDLCLFDKVMVILIEELLEVFPRLVCGRFLPSLLEVQVVKICLVNSVIGCLGYLIGCEGRLAILGKLNCISHVLKVDINMSVNLCRFFQGLSSSLNIRYLNLPIPLHEVFH